MILVTMLILPRREIINLNSHSELSLFGWAWSNGFQVRAPDVDQRDVRLDKDRDHHALVREASKEEEWTTISNPS